MVYPKFEEVSYSLFSHRKVLWTCAECKQESIRRYSSCHKSAICLKCLSKKRNKNQNVIEFERALEFCTKGSQQKVYWTCPQCGVGKVLLFKQAIKNKLCKICSIEKNRPVLKGALNPNYGKTLPKEQVLQRVKKRKQDTAVRLGFSSRAELETAILQFIETSGFAGSSNAVLEKFPGLSAETIRRIIHVSGKQELLKEWGSSTQEITLKNFITSIYAGKIELNSREVIPPKELDIYLPDLKIAIEFNGLYWHSEATGKTSRYHYEKWKACLKQGIKLFTIWEHHYIENPNKIHNFLKNLILPKPKIAARKTELTRDTKQIKAFIEKEHLQGYAHSSEMVGLSYQNEVVAALTIAPHHRKGSAEYVINRVCFGNYRVVGGLEKMLTKLNFRGDLYTWSDNCYAPDPSLYKNSGFELVAELPPDYFYINGNGHYVEKQAAKKDKIQCPDGISEGVFMKSLGYYRVWNCGKRKWKLLRR